MYMIKRSTTQWLDLFSRLKEIKAQYGIKIFQETIVFLDALKHNKVLFCGEKVQIVDLLVEHDIADIHLMKKFLENLNYNFEQVLINIQVGQDKYGLDKIAFVGDDFRKNREVTTLYSKYGYQKIYLPKDVIPLPILDFNLGEIKLSIPFYIPYIMDKNRNGMLERTYYTNDFGFKSETLPLKEEMDQYDFKVEKKKWMDELILNLSYLQNIKVNLILDNPNEKKDFRVDNIYQQYSIITDGLIYDENEKLVQKRNGYFGKIFVKDADVLVLCKRYLDQLSEIEVIIHPAYFKEYMKELDKEQDLGIIHYIFKMLHQDELEKYGCLVRKRNRN